MPPGHAPCRATWTVQEAPVAAWPGEEVTPQRHAQGEGLGQEGENVGVPMELEVTPQRGRIRRLNGHSKERQVSSHS